jgi:hypothetical protein
MDAAVSRLSANGGEMEFANGKLPSPHPAWMPDEGRLRRRTLQASERGEIPKAIRYKPPKAPQTGEFPKK